MVKRLFLFPGQGSQTVGMGKFATQLDPIVSQTFEKADAALQTSLSKLIFEGPEEALKETQNAQPAILTVSVAMGRLLKNKGIGPTIMAGHSLGEYSAVVMSGAMKFEDAVRIVRLRGMYMQDAVPLGVGTMTAVLGAEDAVVEEVCREISKGGDVVEPANYNCPGQIVISGTVAGVEKAVKLLGERGIRKCIALKVSAPFHCSLLKPAADRLALDLRKIEIQNPRVPYIANVDCSLVTKSDQIISRLIEQIYKPVRWSQSLSKIVSEFKPDQMIEVGPGQVVSGHMKKVSPELLRFQTDSSENINKIV